MEKVTIWMFTDNDHGIKISEAILGLGLNINRIEGLDLSAADIEEDAINMVFADIDSLPPEKIVKLIAADNRITGSIKFILLSKKNITGMLKVSFNVMHLEFISKPVDIREFLLLIEKSIIVERYREIMGIVSLEAENRIAAFEGLMSINRKNIFDSEKEKGEFEKILSYEKNLMREQLKLNSAIRDFTMLRQSEYFDMKNRILAEEMLSALRHKEMLEAKHVIDAQESLIDYSAHELDSCKKIISATENVAELSRSEALELHNRLKNQLAVNSKLTEEISRLNKEIKALKK